MDAPQLETFLCRRGDTWCILRCWPNAGQNMRVIVDAGYRVTRPDYRFGQELARFWLKKRSSFAYGRLVKEAQSLFQLEYPVWVYEIRARADLSELVILTGCSWRSHVVHSFRWPVGVEAGEYVLGEITSDIRLPITKRVRELLRGHTTPGDELLVQMRQEWRDYVARLGEGWKLFDPVGDYRAVGPIRLVECECTPGALPDRWMRALD